MAPRRGTDLRTGQPASRSAKPVPARAQASPKKPKPSKIPEWYKINRKTKKTSGKTPGWARPGHGATGGGAFTHGQRSTRRGPTSGGSGSGSGGGGGGGGGPTRPRPPRRPPAASPAAPAAPGAAGAPAEDPDKKMWEELFGPARREIERQRTLLDQKKAADVAAWEKYNTWAEDQRAKSAGLLTTAQADVQKNYSAMKQQSDANIQQFISAARGGSGTPGMGADRAQASGADALGSVVAGQQSAQNLQGQYQQGLDAINNKMMADRALANKAIAQAGSEGIAGQFSKASNALASKSADIETSFQQAKMDKFYKDRQYGLDRETLDWTKSLQGAQLELSREGQILKAQIDSQQLAGTERQRAIDNALATRRITNDEARILQGTVTAGNTQANANITRGGKLLDWIDKTYPDFADGMDSHKQGQAIIKAIARAKAQGLSASLAWDTLESAFGSRFSHPTVFKHFKARYPKFQRR